MVDFALAGLDSNGDALIYTINNTSDFIITDSGVKFKTTNTKPSKTNFSVTVGLDDGVNTKVEKTYTIDVTLRFEKNENIPYSSG